jgi:eukaryotic-like serine/threonine-protein kinase
MVQANCPDENALAEFVQGLLDDIVASEIELHLDGCQECRRIVSSVGQSSYLAARRTRIDSGRADGSHPPTSTREMEPAASSEMKVPEPGTILAGKYRVEGLLGQGGMGVVLAVTHIPLCKLVALKLMRPDLAIDKGAAQRFVREARAASLLRSEHIVRVIDLDTLADGSPYIAMEYLEGEDLGAVLARRGTIPAHEAATYIVQVCEAIGEAHAANIVHRDLKPANLFLTHRAHTPCVKVLDFGVSKIIAGGPLADDVASTDTKSLVGSPHYMAPEQLISAKSVDPRTDVWALGCILYELVSGTSPFATGGALAQVLASILRDHVPPPGPDLPPGFVEVVERCLEKDPARRFQRVSELSAALAPFTAPVQRATAIGVGTPTPPIAATSIAPVALGPQRRRVRLAAVALLLGAIGGYACYRLLRDDGPTVERAAVSTSDAASAPATTAPAPIAPTAAPTAAATAAPTAARITVAPATTVAPPTHELGATPVSPQPAKAAKKRPAKKLEDDLIGPAFD